MYVSLFELFLFLHKFGQTPGLCVGSLIISFKKGPIRWDQLGSETNLYYNLPPRYDPPPPPPRPLLSTYLKQKSIFELFGHNN